MKQIIATLLLTVATFSVSAQFMPTTQGTVYTYESMDASESKDNPKTSTLTITVADVQTADNGVITATVVERNSQGAVMGIEESHSTYSYNPADSVTTLLLMTPEEFKDNMLAVVRQFASEAGQYVSDLEMEEVAKMIKPKGKLEIPLNPNAAEGSSFPNSTIRATVIAQSTGMKIIKGKYAGYEAVSTPVGEFDCLKITYVLAPIGQGIDTYVTSWYAPGIGLVAESVADKKGNVIGRRTLTAVVNP